MFGFKNWIIVEDLNSFVLDAFLESHKLEKCLKTTAEFLFECMSSKIFIESSSAEDEDILRQISSENEEVDRKKAGRQLLNAVLWMRWKAMMDRQAEINKIIQLRDLHKSQNPEVARKIQARLFGFSESSWNAAKAAFAQPQKSQVGFDFKEAESVLKRLGYAGSEIESLSDEDREEKIIELMYRAAEEKGNELPQDVRRMGVERINQKSERAKRLFMDVLMKVFSHNYGQIFRDARNQQRERGGKKRQGDRFFGNPLDVATSFIMRMEKLITKRKVKDGKAKDWYSPQNYAGPDGQGSALGSSGYEAEMLGGSENSRRYTDIILRTFTNWLYKQVDREQVERSKSTTPSRRLPETQVLGGNRTRKSGLITKDLEKAEKEGESALGFYKHCADKIREDKIEEIKPRNMHDKYRLDIMTHISYLAGRQGDLYSLVPSYSISDEDDKTTTTHNMAKDFERLKQVLTNYRDYVLSNRPKPTSTFIGDLVPKGSKEDIETYFDPENTDSVLRGEKTASERGIMAQVSGSETTRTILALLDKIMRELAIKDPKAAFAVCVKWSLGCTPNFANNQVTGLVINSVDEFATIAVAMTRDGRVAGGKRIDCEKQLQSIGIKDYKSVLEAMKALIPDLDLTATTVGLHLNNGLKYICHRMREELSNITL